MAIGTKQYKRGLIIAGVTFMVMFAVMIKDSNVVMACVTGLTFSIFGYLIGSRVTDELVLQQALGVAQEHIPAFTVDRHLIGVGSESGILLDQRNNSFLVFDNFGKRHSVLPESAMMACDVIEDGATVSTITTSRTSQLAGAAVGGLVFGGIGAVVGALSGKKKSVSRNDLSEISLRLTVADRTNPVYRITLFKVAKPVLKSSAQGRKAIRSAEDAEGLLQIIMQQSQAA